MASVKKHFSQHINRLNQAFSQSIGRSEKSDVLAGDLQNVDQRVECMVDVLKHTKKKLAECLRSKKAASTKEDLEKRRHALDEYKLSHTILSEAKNMEAIFAGSLLSDVMTQYGDALSSVVQDLVKAEIQIENSVLEKVSKFSEELENISQQKDKLKKLVLDMDSARSRLNTAQSRGDERVNEIQDEFDNAYTKVENCKDAFAADLYTLASKEVEMASLYRTLLEIQIDYHRHALSRLETAMPATTKRIDTYPRRPVYGCSLDDHLRYSGREIALVLEVCCTGLMELGLKDEGLFRISGNATKIRKLKAAFDAGETVLSDSDPHSIAGALKSYLRELPDPLMCSSLCGAWLSAFSISDPEARLSAVRNVLTKLPRSNYANLRYLVRFLSKLLDNQVYTKMSSQNLAIVMAPNMIWNPSEGEGFGLSTAHGALVELLVANANDLFSGDVQFSSSPVNSGNGFDNHLSARQSPLSVDVSFRGSRGASDDSLNVDKQISPAKSASRKSKPPPPPPAPSTALSPRSSTTVRSSFQPDHSTALKTVDISGADAVAPSPAPAAEQPASIPGTGHRKSNSLDRPVRPPWTLGAESGKALVTSASAANESVDQFSASASDLDGGDVSKQPDDFDATKSATLPRPQQRVQPPPLPSKGNVSQQGPSTLDALEAPVPPTMVRVSMSDDSDEEEPVVEETGGRGQRRSGSQSDSGNERRSLVAKNEPQVLNSSSAPKPMPRRQPTSPKEVSYVSVAEENDKSYQMPITPSRLSSNSLNTSQQQEASSASTPVRPKPPVPSKPRGLESPEKDSIVRL